MQPYGKAGTVKGIRGLGYHRRPRAHSTQTPKFVHSVERRPHKLCLHHLSPAYHHHSLQDGRNTLVCAFYLFESRNKTDYKQIRPDRPAVLLQRHDSRIYLCPPTACLPTHPWAGIPYIPSSPSSGPAAEEERETADEDADSWDGMAARADDRGERVLHP